MNRAINRATIASAGTWLPASAAAVLRRCLTDGAGLVITLLAGLMLLAVASYNPADPSFNHATEAEPVNMLGSVGAYAADVLLHGLGVVVILPILALAVWGWRMVRRLPLPAAWLRTLLLAAGTVLLAAAATALPVPAGWPLAIGLGGVIGMVVLDAVGALMGAAGGSIGAGLAALGLVVTGIGLAVASFGLRAGEWVAIGRMLRRALAATWRLMRRWNAWARGLDIGLGAPSGTAAATRAMQDVHVPRHHDARPTAAAEAGAATQPAARPGIVVPPRRTTGTPDPRQGRLALDEEPGDPYRAPPLDVLRAPPPGTLVESLNREALEENARLLASVLEDFGVRGEIVKIRPGPVVTLYELEPAPGTKSSRVIGLAEDIARSMSAISVRVAVVPGRNVIGIELPNQRRETVYLRELLESDMFRRNKDLLTLILGKDIGGAPVLVDLARMPHLLIAGTTGSGKSVAINTMILSLLYQHPAEACRFILIDPKMLELSVYDGIPHLLAPVVTDPAKAVVALKWTVREMEERYRMMSQLGVRNIGGFNARIAEAARRGENLVRRVQTGFDDDGRPVFEEQPLDLDPLPLIVVVVDEMADLMLVAGKDIEAAVQRLAQMARAAGIHLIMATQRPSVDVITGTIKANFPTRISFHVTSKIDSRTILGEQGAEQLLGQGDMLYMATGGRVTRVHGPFVSDVEVEAVVAHLRSLGEPRYLPEVTEDDGTSGGIWGSAEATPGGGSEQDDLYDEAVALIAREGKASTSFVQRRLQIGYNRAARLVERMEQEGVVSRPDRVGRREVLVGDQSA
ncbi:MAG: DNA translocase FtsK [Rhodospirillales bacterium]|nr:MAG: DNA translocase FtsK [Rhodospirillales bacterium]